MTALHHAGLLAPAHTGLSVWCVWEEEGPLRGLYATKAAAEQGTVEVYEETEGHCPDYSWPIRAGVRELAAGSRWAILAGRRSGGNRMAWVGDRWQALPVTGPVGRWEYESAQAALDAATALAEQMETGGERP
ncbi:hypothetical protein [Actinacidiphila sp. bgisy145]|uniref:hypothetical protein n=1 Tax=Actinacidiphila sp. bgisy145 TaxID=3413792 RepID=UPI003EBC6F97